MQFLFLFLFIYIYMKNMLGKILGFARTQQNIFSFLECFKLFFFEIFRRKPGILIPDLYFTV